ncbi:MAG: glycosyltransferase 87 family protein, partial [Acidimicrobiia bacterium]|nr:glycosyltransferase 87 family protein [Acidimicrobiia bacterium]MDX2468489.1 glycosyltransferase 87 family protein [Acidimicrobiia bacterium]
GWLAVGLVLLSVPGLWTIQLGQMGLWVGALLFAVFLSLRSGHLFRAGLLLGLLAFKPTYAVGIGIWWLIRAKRYGAAIAGAAVSATACVATGFAIPGAWSDYLGLVDDSGQGMFESTVTSGFSILEMLLLIFPESSLAVVMWVVATVVLLVAFWLVLRNLEFRLEAAFALAVVVGLLIAPRLGWYDWVLLVVPGVLVWQGYPRLHSQTVVAGAWLFLGAALSWMPFWREPLRISASIQFAPLLLLGVSWWWCRQAMQLAADDSAPALTVAPLSEPIS